MASLISQKWKADVFDGDKDLEGANWWMALLMTNTTADTEPNVNTVSAYTTLDEMDGANYVRKAISNPLVVRDDANGRIEWDMDDPGTWSSLGNGTRAIQGTYVYWDADDDGDPADDAANDSGVFNQFGVNQNPGGGNFTVNIDAEGLVQAA